MPSRIEKILPNIGSKIPIPIKAIFANGAFYNVRIFVGLQDRVIQTFGGVVFMDFNPLRPPNKGAPGIYDILSLFLKFFFITKSFNASIYKR